jgi:hypothetical protein
MSIDFVINRRDVPFNELVPRLAPFGITERVGENTRDNAIFLTDNETGGIWAYKGEDGMFCAMTCYAPNGNPGRVFAAIRKAFDVQIAVCSGYKIKTDLAGHRWQQK